MEYHSLDTKVYINQFLIGDTALYKVMGFIHFKHMVNVNHCYHWYIHPGHYVSRPNASFLLKCYNVQVQEIMYVGTEELIREVNVG